MKQDEPTPRQYYDITDLVSFFRSNQEVTGIQRVQTRILSSLVRQGIGIDCLIHDAENARFVQVPAEALFREGGADLATQFRSILPPARQPLLDKAAVKQVLQPYEHRKILRATKKAQLYAWRVIRPSRMAELGYQTSLALNPCVTRAVRPFEGPGASDQYILLGHNWSTPAIFELATAFVRAGGQAIQVIHDLIAMHAPEHFPTRTPAQFKAFMQQTMASMSAYICVSEFTRDDLLRFLGDDARGYGIHVLKLAHSLDGAPKQQVATPLPSGVPGRFALCVGTIEPRKNGLRLLEAWSLLHQRLGPALPTLVMAGKLGWKTGPFVERLHTLQAQGVPVLHAASPTDTELQALYSHCLFTVYPSLYEGWGLPVGESMAFSKICLASRASSIPEVASDAAAYFDPEQPACIADLVQHLLTHESFRQDLQARVDRFRLRSWDDVSRDLQRLLAAPPPDRTAS